MCSSHFDTQKELMPLASSAVLSDSKQAVDACRCDYADEGKGLAEVVPVEEVELLDVSTVDSPGLTGIEEGGEDHCKWPVLPRPEKNYSPFIMESKTSYSPRQIVENEIGELPLLLGVSVGYDSEESDPYMSPYETQEILFAYKEGSQQRVLIQDSHHCTLSLPVDSNILFRVGIVRIEELTLSQILAGCSLPVYVRFAHPHTLSFQVDNQTVDHTFFGKLLLTKVYDEPFFWCLSIEPSGKIREVPTVLPRNLKGVYLAPIVGIKGAADSAAKVKEFLDRFSQTAQLLNWMGDPFFQDLAFVSRGPLPMGEVMPYIEKGTFVTILDKRRPVSAGNFMKKSATLYLHEDMLQNSAKLSKLSLLKTKGRSLSEAVSDRVICYQNDRSGTDGREAEASETAENAYNEPLEVKNANAASFVLRPVAISSFTATSPDRDSDIPWSPPPSPPYSETTSVSSVSYVSSVSSTSPPAFNSTSWLALSLPSPSPSATTPTLSLSTSSVFFRPRSPRSPLPPLPGRSSPLSAFSSPSSSPPPYFMDTVPRQGKSSISEERGIGRKSVRRATSMKLVPETQALSSAETRAVDSLSINDVSVRLRQLGLGKYVRKFRKKRIDGVLLRKLPEDTLSTEFGLSKVEVIILNTFVTEGHIAKL